MGIVSLFRLFRECFRIAGRAGLIACCKYLSGGYRLPDLDVKGSVSRKVIFMSRILRSLVCLLLICCILVNLSPLKAHALDPVTVGFVGVSAVVGVACIMQALGYMAASNSEPFTNTVNQCVDYLTDSTSFVTNGLLTFAGYRSGQLSSMYAMRDLVQEIWVWLFGSGSVIDTTLYPISTTYSSSYFGITSEITSSSPVYAVHYAITVPGLSDTYHVTTSFISADSFKATNAYSGSSSLDSVYAYHSITLCQRQNVQGLPAGFTLVNSPRAWLAEQLSIAGNDTYVSYNDDISLGQIQSPYQTVGTDEEIIEIEIAPVYIDLTKEIQEFPDPNNPSDDPDLDKKIPWLPIRIPSKNYDDTVINQTQQESWTGESEVEFEFDYGDSSGDGSGNTGTDSGSTGNTGSSWKPPSNHNQFKLVDLSKFFPFCIPFDLFDFFKLLNADPVAPSFTWEIQDLSGQTYGLTVDLSQWDSVAQLFRRLQLFLFVCGLAAASRKYIKW